MLRLAVRFLVPAVLAAGCGDDDGGPAASGTPPPPVSGVGSSTTESPPATDGSETAADSAMTGGVGATVCAACAEDEFCVADHQSGVTDPEALEFTCRSGADACVAPGDASVWCGNDSACCEGACDEFGRCGFEGAGTGTSTGTGTGTSGTTGTTGTTGTGDTAGVTTGTGTTGTTGG